MRILFTNSTLYDGTGCPPSTADILVDAGRIAAITAPGELQPDAPNIPLNGLALCPGFIDTHSHSDLVVLEDPMVLPKIRQGITTEIVGQDGIAMAPLPEQYISKWRKNIAGLDGVSEKIDWNYRTTEGYLQALQQHGVGTNICTLVPHGNIRMEAMGLGEEQASAADLERMCAILQREIDAGAFGLSTGLIYPPCTYADGRELEALCSVAAQNGVPLVIHQRSEADTIVESMQEVLAIGRATGVHVHFSHFKICGKYNADKLPKVITLLDQAAANGQRVTFDQYPYIAGSTMLSAILPPWMHAGGTEAMLQRLADPAMRDRVRRDIEKGSAEWDNFVAFAGYDGISVTNVSSQKNRGVIGMNLTELGQHKRTDPLTAALDLLAEEENGVSMVDFYGLEEHVETFMQRPEMNVCTDGLMLGTPHPRTYGAFPRVLAKYSRERQLFPPEEAIRRMTLQPATVFGLQERGQIAPGNFADIVIFDPETICDTATFTEPRQFAAGIRMVMVNGEVVFAEDGLLHDSSAAKLPSGMVLRK